MLCLNIKQLSWRTAVKADEAASVLYAEIYRHRSKVQMGQLIEPEQQNEAQALFAELQANSNHVRVAS